MAERRVSWIISANISNWTKNLDKANKRMDRFGKDMQSIGRNVSTYVSAPLAAFSGMALRTAANFEESMNRVGAITQATGDDFTRLEQTARDLGATTAFSASEAADGMSFLAQAGFDVNDVIGSMPAVLNLAAAAKMDLAQASDIASNIMSGFGMTTDELAGAVDVMAKTTISANTDVEQLGEAMKMVAPVASGFGVQFEETAAAVGFLSDAGLQASQAGTGLRRIMTTLSQSADELGINVMDSAGNMLPLADIIEQIEDRGLSATDAMQIFGERGGPAMQVLLSRGSGALRDMTSELESAGGTAQRVADQQLQGFNGMLKQLGSAWEELQITFMSAGGLESSTSLLEHGTRLLRNATNWFKSLGEQAQTTIHNIVLGLMTVGPAIVGVGLAISGLSVAIGLLTSPITLTIGIIAGLAAAVLYVYENWDALIERVSDVGWWRNAIISMIQFWADYNPFRLIIKGYNRLLEAIGMKPIPDPFVIMSDKLEDLKVDTKEYEHQFKSFSDTVMGAVNRWTGIDFSGMFSGGGIETPDAGVEEWSATTKKKVKAVQWPDIPLSITPPNPKTVEGPVTTIEMLMNRMGNSMNAAAGKAEVMGQALQSTVGNALTSFAETLGNAFTGDAGASGFFNNILLIVADFGKQLGRMLIAAGIAAQAFKKLLLNPIGAIIAGGALIAASTAVSNILKKGPSGSTTSVNDALIRSDGSIVKFHPDDNILAMKDFGGLSGGGGGMSSGSQVIRNTLNLDGQVVWRNQKSINHRKRR